MKLFSLSAQIKKFDFSRKNFKAKVSGNKKKAIKRLEESKNRIKREINGNPSERLNEVRDPNVKRKLGEKF